MAVITISRQAGSNGTLIGQQIAEKLGYLYVDKTHIGKIMKEYGFSTFGQAYDSIPTFWEKVDKWRATTFDFLKEVEIAFAARDNVVMAGRGGYALLKDFDDVMNVRIKAPFEYRVEQVAKRKGMSIEAAREYTAEKDSVRRHFVESDIHFSYTDSTMFDIILDTSLISSQDCVDMLVKAVKTMENRKTEKSVTLIEINPVLKGYIDQLFKDQV